MCALTPWLWTCARSVNNVGKSHDMPVPFAETSPEELEDIVEINVAATLRVSRMVVPGMVER